jgi:dynein heavy chain, axonemal
LSSIPAYHIPRDGSLESYRDFLDLLPPSERAESVGQHASADVATLAQVPFTIHYESVPSFNVQQPKLLNSNQS